MTLEREYWRSRAACQGADLAVFFPNSGDDLDEARRLCTMCPVRSSCLADALRLRDLHGFRAGLTGDERRALWFAQQQRQGNTVLGNVDTIPTLGIVRRRRALGCMGYSLQDLADHLGVSESTIASHAARARILRATFERWRQLYDGLKDKPGGNEKARQVALKMGWAPPSAWDANTIDDPAAQPLIEQTARGTYQSRVYLGSRGARLRAARAAFVRGVRDEWAVEGNREYERLRKQRHRDRHRDQSDTKKGAA